MNRREALAAMSCAGVSSVLPDIPRQDAASRPGIHDIKPLPFDPKKLAGLSEKLLVSHHENNYAGAVRNLNKVEADLARVTKDTPAFVIAGLKERELNFRNSATLHEHYFANLGGDGKLAGAIAAAIAASHGSLARWEELFRATAMSLAGGSGWVVLMYDLYRDGIVTCWSSVHTQNHAVGLPLLVLDMYEHSYHIDFGSAAARYIEAFCANVNWEIVEKRFAAARRAVAALRS